MSGDKLPAKSSSTGVDAFLRDLNRAPAVRLNADEAARQGVANGASARVGNAVLPVVVDGTVPDGAVWIEAAHDLTATLPAYGAFLTLSKA